MRAWPGKRRPAATTLPVSVPAAQDRPVVHASSALARIVLDLTALAHRCLLRASFSGALARPGQVNLTATSERGCSPSLTAVAHAGIAGYFRSPAQTRLARMTPARPPAQGRAAPQPSRSAPTTCRRPVLQEPLIAHHTCSDHWRWRGPGRTPGGSCGSSAWDRRRRSEPERGRCRGTANRTQPDWGSPEYRSPAGTGVKPPVRRNRVAASVPQIPPSLIRRRPDARRR